MPFAPVLPRICRDLRCETDDEKSLVVKFFHQSELFLQSHGSRTANRCSGLGVVREFHGDKTAGVEDEIGLFEEVLAFNGDQFRSPGPAPTISMNPRRSAVRFMATAKVKSLPSLSLPFCFSRSSRVFPVDFRAAASATLGKLLHVLSPRGLGTLMSRSSSGE